MKKFSLFGRSVVVGKDLSPLQGLSDSEVAFLEQRYGLDYTKRSYLKAYKNIVFDCVSLAGEAIADYQPIYQVKQGDNWVEKDHEFINLLKKPSGDLQREPDRAAGLSQFELFEATGIYQLLQGDGYWYMALGKTTGRPREIILLRPDKVGVDVDKDTGKINGYFIRRQYAEPIPLETREILRFPVFNPLDPYNGKSTIEAANDYIKTDEATSEFTKNFFYNNAGIPGVLNVKGEVSKNAFKKFVRGWREKHEGVSNAGKVAILRDTEAVYTKVGLGLNEIDMSALRDMTIKDVLMAFKTPLPLLGQADQTGLGRGNVEALEYIYAKYNIDKKMKRFDKVLEFAMERYYGFDPSRERIVHENIIPEDKEFKLLEREKSVDKYRTRNEIRQEDGLDAIEGGDQLFVPLNNVPINESSMTPPTDESKSIRVKIIRTVKKKDYEVTAEKAERFRLSIMRNQTRYERQYKKVLTPVFQKQHKEALVNLEAFSAGLKKDAQIKLFDDAAYDELMTEGLMPMMTDLVETQGALALTFAGDDENEFHMTDRISRKIERGTMRMARKYNDDTIEYLNATLTEGIRAGEGIDSLRRRVGEIYKDVSGFRLERIARTETLKASNAATTEAYKQTGYVTGKQWVTNPGACAQCDVFSGKTIALDEDYLQVGESYTYTDEHGEEKVNTNTYDTVQEPPLHPNCRCTVAPTR